MEKACLMAGFLILVVAIGFAAGVNEPDVPVWQKDAKELKREKIQANREELRRIKLVDSVGWLKVTSFRRADESMDKLEQERQQRKIANLIDFCDEARFPKKEEVDSLSEMTAEERNFCKERLKLVNPLIP
ncbi:MAG: hypothetical protein JWO30_599 [Fibrobacteres bacterium]|nr:hypothetical protein [Fibrobacterota bacterium]